MLIDRLPRGRHESVTTPTKCGRAVARMERIMSGVSAAPNRARITGVVDRVEPSSTSDGKWYLTVDVHEAEAIEGGLFARPGGQARVFAFGAAPPVDAGRLISAEVEYLGGPTGGEFQLLRLLDEPGDEIRAAETTWDPTGDPTDGIDATRTPPD
jgi:hypothetical protein